jgi:CubicO group peptidase (beta-lactamase class C family)
MKGSFCAHSLIVSIFIVFCFQVDSLASKISVSDGDSLSCIIEKHKTDITLLRNRDDVIPLKDLDKGKFACVVLGDAPVFENRVRDYLEMPVFHLRGSISSEEVSRLVEKAGEFDRLIIAIADSIVSEEEREFVFKRGADPRVVTAFFNDLKDLNSWKGIEKNSVLLYAGNNTEESADSAAQILFGAIGVSGTLQEPVGDIFHKGEGIKTNGSLRLGYATPRSIGLNGDRLSHRIDSLISFAIKEKAFPGCQILMAVDGKVIFRRSFGYQTYNNRTAVSDSDLYDLASVTKVCGTLPVIMQLNGQGAIDLDEPLSRYWTDWKKGLFHPSNKDTLTVRQILAHQARLVPYLNFWKETVKDGHYKRRLFSSDSIEHFTLNIDDHLFLKDRFKNRIYRMVRKSDLLPEAKYKYSGLSFLIYPGMITRLTGRNYEQVLYDSVYKPLGTTRLVYNPLQKGFCKEEIVPTEVDMNFRNTLVRGHVHDEAAAVFGGVSGNAGLFANANDLAKLMQLYLNMGSYGGEEIIPVRVMEEFTRVQYPGNDNRRGLGFDKPSLDNAGKDIEHAYPAPGVSAASFGHSGFTGTFVWADPEYKVIYVFLSNRVYPSRSHTALIKYNIRTTIQQFLYDEIFAALKQKQYAGE